MKIILAVLAGSYLLGCVILYLMQEKFIFRGVPLDQDHTFDFPHVFEEIFLDTEDGGRINILHFTRRERRGTIIYYHGNKGNLDRWGKIVAELLPLGYEVAVMDYRGYGKSVGKRNQRTLLSDALLFFDHIRSIRPTEEIVIYGRSLGTSMASYVASNRDAKALILESPFFSLRSLVQSWVPLYPMSPVIRYPLPTNIYLKNVRSPVYIFHGTLDQVVPYKQGLRLYRSIENSQTKLITLDGSGHDDLMESDEYWDNLRSILE